MYYWWPWETDHICCDCGLTHKVRIELVHTGGKGKRKYKLMASWEVLDKETKRQRKNMKCVIRKTR